jgi:pilus assembly protein FimV
MSGGKNPLMLMMALSMPGAAHALGLGDIHVESALNERLSAVIDIVGATPLELNDLRAAVANRETFLRHGAERPAFLASTTFKVTEDGQGRPVLAVRSSESFTEPVVSFLVDLHWRTGELVREYTLLLDPAGASSPAPDVAPAIASVAPETARVAPAIASVATDTAPAKGGPEHIARKTTHIKVGAKATLRGIAWRVGERSESDLQKMMIAIFRANPDAFDGNINRLHLGAVLTVPSRAEAAAISKTEAKREISAQMAAWHSGGAARVAAAPKPAAKSRAAAAPMPASASPAASALPVTIAPVVANAVAAAQPDTEALSHRIQSLEQELRDLKGSMDSERTQLSAIQAQADRMEKPAPSVAAVQRQAQAVGAQPEKSKPEFSSLVPVLGGVGTLAAVIAALYVRFRRRAASPAARSETESAPDVAAVSVAIAETAPDPAPEPARAPEPVWDPFAPAMDAEPSAVPEEAPAGAAAGAPASDYTVISAGPPVGIDATHPMLPAVAAAAAAGRSEIATGTFSTAAQLDPTVNLRLDPPRLDFNLLDLDLTAQHVQMPSVLNEHAVVKERRTNLADVLKLAIAREPDRHDLRLKLLELYYAAADSNRKAFLDVVQKLAGDRDHLNPEQWDKITTMGRKIASDDPLFSETAGDNLADCA